MRQRPPSFNSAGPLSGTGVGHTFECAVIYARGADRYFVFVGVTRPFLHASVNSALESLSSLLVSTELKFFTADWARAFVFALAHGLRPRRTSQHEYCYCGTD